MKIPIRNTNDFFCTFSLCDESLEKLASTILKIVNSEEEEEEDNEN